MQPTNSIIKRNQSFLGIAALAVLGFVVKGWFLAEASLGTDECFSVYYAQLPVLKIAAILGTGNNPPLHEILLHFWIKVFGISEFAVRFPSLVFSCLAVVPVYFIGEKFLRRGVGIIAALLFTFSTFSLFIAQEARTYNLVLFLTCCSFYTFLSICDKGGRSRWWLLLALLNALLCYSHYLAIWVIVVQGVAALSHSSLRKKIFPLFLLHGLGVLVLFSPFIPVLLRRFSSSAVQGTWVQKVTGPAAFYNMLWTFSNAPVSTVVFLVVMGLALIAAIYKNGGKPTPAFSVQTVLLWVWLPLVASFLLSIKTGFFFDRYMFFTSPGYYLCLGLASLQVGEFLFKKYRFILPAACIALMFAGFKLHSKGQKYGGSKKDMQALVAKIKEVNNGHTAIVICPDWFDKNVVYYLDRPLFTTYFEQCESDVVFKEPLAARNIFFVRNKDEVKIPEGYTRLVYVDDAADFHFPQNGILDALQQRYRLNETHELDGKVKVYVFANI